MKLKALLVAGAVCLVSAVNSSAAEVFSANTVGFVNKTIPAGFSMVANPVVAADNSIQTLFTDLPSFSRVYKFDPVAGTYSIFTKLPTAWVGDAAGTTLMPGEGVFVYNNGAELTITFTGEVAQGAASNITIGQGFSIISSVVAQGGLLKTDLGFPAANFDRVYKFNNGDSSYSISTYLSGTGTWIGGEPTVDVGEAFFVNKQAETAWDRNFDPNAGS
jgi:hypothetical protein